ncbi:MAG: ATP-dependent helicase [Thermoplasmata archaeon]|nr:MAG: ATP-dependent helicase [Thermoplasmata archaeon]
MKIEEIVSDKRVVELLHKDGIVEATKVQEKSIPLIMDGKDVVVQSETGSGKTLAFVLPIIENISGDKIEALVIAPTRELAKQITYVFKRYSQFNAVSIYGGVSITNQIKNLKTANIIVGTPGRLLDLLDRGELHIDEIKYLVLDEADRMLDMGFIDDIEKIMKRTNENRQTLLFSATIPKEVIDMSNRYMIEPAKVMIKGVVTTAKLCHKFYVVSFKEKFSLLVHLLQTKDANLSLIFCATKKMADNLARELQRYDIRAKAIHGDLSQNQREQVLHDFRQKRIDVLVATDVAARGLDIDDITHIYNFDLPNEILMYTHRAGRTARMGNEGEVISLVSEKDYLLFGKIKKTENIEEMKKPNFRRLFFKMEKGGMKHNGYRKKTKYHGRGRRY